MSKEQQQQETTSGQQGGEQEQQQGNTPPEGQQGQGEQQGGQQQEEKSSKPTQQQDKDTFSRDYVENLRNESAGHRTKATEYAKRAHAALVKADGRLVDPDALPFDVAHLESETGVTDAITALIEAKPYLNANRVGGDIGQHDEGKPAGGEVSLLGIMQNGV